MRGFFQATWVLGFLSWVHTSSCVRSLWRLLMADVSGSMLMFLSLSIQSVCPAPPGTPWMSMATPPASLVSWTSCTSQRCWPTPASSLATGQPWCLHQPLEPCGSYWHCKCVHPIKASCAECKQPLSSVCRPWASYLSITLTEKAFRRLCKHWD